VTFVFVLIMTRSAPSFSDPARLWMSENVILIELSQRQGVAGTWSSHANIDFTRISDCK
jgi:hypothetical protein